MIKVKNLVPSVYYDRSRDFQLLGRIFELVFNYTKMNTDLMYNNPISDNSNDTLLDLLTTTLGFKSRHNYNVKQLHSMCTAFMTMLKNKGNIQSIKLAVNTILQAEGIDKDGEVVVDENNPYNVYIYIPTTYQNLPLLNDLLVYILPAGCSTTIVQRQFVPTAAETELEHPAESYTLVGNPAIMTSVVASANPEELESGIESGAYSQDKMRTISRLSGLLDNSTVVGTRTDLERRKWDDVNKKWVTDYVRKKQPGEWGE